MSFEVDKGIPPKNGKYGFPFSEMEIGDSFYIDCREVSIEKWRMRLSNEKNSFIKKNNKNFKILSRKEGDGMRVWRTK